MALRRVCALTEQGLHVLIQVRGPCSVPTGNPEALGGVAATLWHLVALAYFTGVAWGPTSSRHTGDKVTALPAQLGEGQLPFPRSPGGPAGHDTPPHWGLWWHGTGCEMKTRRCKVHKNSSFSKSTDKYRFLRIERNTKRAASETNDCKVTFSPHETRNIEM